MERKAFDELIKLVQEEKFPLLRSSLIEMNVVDIADFMEELSEEQRVVVFRILPKDISAEVFSYLGTDAEADIVSAITNRELSSLVDKLYLDDTVDFLEEVPANVVSRVLAVADEQKRTAINNYLKYPENCAGSVMTSELISLHDRLTVQEALTSIKKTGVNKETIYTCYCINDSRRLVGTVGLNDLIFSSWDTPLREIMDDGEQIISVSTLQDREEVADIARKYDLLSVPVCDKEGRLVGIITIDDIVDIIQEENTEDFERMAMLKPSENEYLKTSVWKLSKNRIMWLMILMVSATFTGKIIESYESMLANFIILTSAIPMLMDTGGNAGNQVSTLIIRGLALGEIKIFDYFKVLYKELRVSIICGICLSAANFIRMIILNGTQENLMVYFVVSLAMFCAVVFAKLIGCTLPILAKLLKLDPALMAGPMITTIVDAVTLIIYFSLSHFILNIPIR